MTKALFKDLNLKKSFENYKKLLTVESFSFKDFLGKIGFVGSEIFLKNIGFVKKYLLKIIIYYIRKFK